MTNAALGRYAPLNELNYPIEIGSGIVTPAQLRAMAKVNLGLTSNTDGVGTVTTSATTTQSDYFDGVMHHTKLTLTAFALGTAPDNASLAFGAKFWSLPAGAFVIQGAVIRGGITAALSATNQTPEVGIGTVIGSTAIAALTTTMEDIVDGGANGLIGGSTVAPDVAGTVFAKGSLAASSCPGVYIATSGGKSHDLFLNVAAAWADVTAAGAATFTGTIDLRWYKIS